MMEAPRWALSGLVLGLAIAIGAQTPQDAGKALQADIKKVEEKIKEESERVARKKENLQVEFAALQKDEIRASLQAKLGEIGAKHRAAVKGTASRGQESRPALPESLKTAVQDEVRAAVSATVGRNLATILDKPIASTLIEALGSDTPPDYQAVLKDTVDLEFSGTDFEANYRRLMPTFEAKLADLQGELATLKQKLADLDQEARSRQMNNPPGMVLVPAGKYRIGSDTAEFEAIKKLLGFDKTQGNIDKYVLGWPAHEVQLDDFYIDVNEVTNRQWAEFVKDTQRKVPEHWKHGDEKKEKEKEKSSIPLPNGSGPAPTTQPSEGGMMPDWMLDLPVTYITWDDAIAYCEWMGRRLPTEFEWEAAARFKGPGDKQFHWFPWGDTYDRNKAYCNNQTAASHPLRQRHELSLTPVGSFPLGKSVLGINDLAGNAAEFTSSYFNPYPNWDDKKVPSTNAGKEPFSGSDIVLRGGTALATELYTLTTTRKPMTKHSADLVGFRTALSRVKGKDFVESITGNQLAAQLGQVDVALKDEKSGRPELAVNDPTRYTLLTAGGWDAARHVPTRAQYISVIGRNTLEFTDPAKVKSLAREHKKPLMLGYFTSAVDFVKPVEIPKGTYWVLWDPGRVKGTGKEKVVLPEGVTLRSVSNPDLVFDIPGVTPVFVTPSSEATKLSVDKTGTQLSVLMTFPVRDRKPNEARFIIEMKLETAPEALKPFK